MSAAPLDDEPPMPAEAATEIGADPRDVDMSHVFPLERFVRRHPSFPFWLVLSMALVGAWIDSPQLWSY